MQTSFHRWSIPLAVCAAAAGISHTPVRAAAQTDTVVARAMAAPAGQAAVIARFTEPLTPGDREQLAGIDAQIVRDLPIIQSAALRLPASRLVKLTDLPFVSHVSSDGTVAKCDEFTTEASGAAIAMQQYGVTGQGVTVAVLDSGVNNVQDFTTSTTILNQGLGLLPILSSSRLLASISFVPGDTRTTDVCGHGTHVAGIVAGNGSGSSGLNFYRTFYGVARKANLVNVRVLDGSGAGNVGSVVAGIQWVVAHKNQYNIRVINLSLGHPVGESYTTDPLCQAAEQAWKAGVVVVCAAGNYGRLDAVQDQTSNEGWGIAYGSIQSPGNDPYVITVGATKNTDGNRADDQIATYSSRGPSRLDLVLKPDIVAPGNRVISTDAKGSTLDKEYDGTNQIPWSNYCRISLEGNSASYFCLSGTSMASPVVAGAAALMLQRDPSLTPDTVKARLMISADKMDNWLDADGNRDVCTYGAGYLDIPAALANTVKATTYALSPSLVMNGDGTASISLDSSVWNSHALWGSNVTDLNTVWGDHALWGSTTLSDSHALWGSSVWSDHALWGSSTSAVDLTSTAIKGE